MSGTDDRLETLIALHLDALDESEAATVRARIASDPEWRALDERAKRMLGILEEAALPPTPPHGLAARTTAALAATQRPPAPWLSMRLAAAVLGIAALPILWILGQWLLAGPPRASIVWKPSETIASGGWFGPRVVVRDSESGEPIGGATLRAVLAPKEGEEIPLGEGTTDDAGVLSTGGWRLPDLPPGEARLSIEAEHGPRVEAKVHVTSEARLVLSPDRQRVRPGERLRVRALLVSTDGALPLAGKEVEISLDDPRGNRVAVERRETTRFGLAWADFPIDDEALEGEWTLHAKSDGQAHASAVTVRRDVLPSYRVTVRLDRRSVKPLGRFAAKISARTFDGEVVRNLSAEVIVGGSGGRKITLADGTATVDLDAPDREGTVKVEVRVSDDAGRDGAGVARIQAAKDAARVIALPEAGELVPGVENRVYLVALRADGGTLPGATIEVKGKGTFAADARGVAVLAIAKPRAPAEVLSLRAVVDGEATAWNDVALDVRPSGPLLAPRESAGSLLLRTDRALVEAGGAIEAEVFSSRERGLAALELRLDGRSIAVAGAELSKGVGRAKLHVPGGIQGLLTLHASMFAGAETWTDRRVVIVRGSRDLRVSVAADRERYRPGETATLSCVVTDGDGRGVPSALSLVAVDEALLALTGDHGGLAQAWQEQAGRALRRPGADLDPKAIDDGGAPLAHATTAALRPPTVAGVVAQLEDILPLDEMEGYEDRLERLFGGGELSAEDLRYRETLLSSLRELEHGATADALLHLSNTRTAARTQGWSDTAPAARAEAEARRATIAHRLELAVALLAAAALAVLILRRGMDAGNALAMLTFLWLVAGIAVAILSNRSDGALAWVLLQAIVLAAQLRVAFRARGLHMGLLGFEHVIGALLLASGQPELLLLGVLLLPIVAAAQATRRAVFGWVLTGVSCTLLLGFVMAVMTTQAGKLSVEFERRRAAQEIVVALARRESEMSIGARGRGGHIESAVTALPPRLREDFRETLLFAPEVVTGEDGRATVEVPLSDSLTGWRILADAIAAKGGVAEGRTRIAVSLPLSVDLRLPAGGVVEGDEMDVRAVVSNHTAEARRLRVDLEAEGAERLDAGARDVEIEPNAVAVADFRVRFGTPGTATLRIALGDLDRVERTVVVHRNARRVEFGETRRVAGEAAFAVRMPSGLSRDDLRGEIRVERGVLAPALEGLDAMLREPYGCFEQTSSIHYPNVLVLRQLELKGSDPDAIRRARDLVARGYQRLLGFEVNRSGLFSLYGKAPGSPWLTAYGLLQFRAMEGVHPVDPNLLGRIERALLRERQGDGSFGTVAQTAYAVLALGRGAPAESCAWLLGQRAQVEADPYLCALVSYALREREPAAAAQFASRLGALAARDGDRAFLKAETTLAWGYGPAAMVEATAIGALALLDGGDRDLAQRFLDAVVAARMPRGDWGSTHATAWALRAIEQAASAARGPAPRTIVEVDGRAFELEGDSPRAPLGFEKEAVSVRARVDGGPAVVTVRGRGFAPWDAEAEGVRGPTTSVEWDRTDLAAGETALATIRLDGGAEGAKVPMVAWGLFAGAEPVASDLERLVKDKRIERFERSGNEVRIYLKDIAAGASVQLSVRLRATARGSFTATPSRAWEYYRPDAMATLRPARFTVR